MWIPSRTFELFHISKDTVDSLREDLASVRAERDGLKSQLATTQANFEWIRIRLNALEFERAQLLEKAYGVKVPVPEIVRSHGTTLGLTENLFEDMGEPAAKELGLPSYGNN